jgi:hypothetical protein
MAGVNTCIFNNLHLFSACKPDLKFLAVTQFRGSDLSVPLTNERIESFITGGCAAFFHESIGRGLAL